MTPEEQRKTIASACPQVAEIDSDNGGIFWKKDPFMIFDPLEDLNAMHEVENTLNVEKADDYGSILFEMVETRRSGKRNIFLCYHATAAQRAEAYLKTIGKWKY